jgi:hypothetical protein
VQPDYAGGGVMIIKETIERECCQENDLQHYCGLKKEGYNIYPMWFCVHCGQPFVRLPQGDKEKIRV